MLQPINRLPPEILSLIARQIPNSADENVASVIPLTHVCQYWRSSIISAPENWTRISSRSKPLAALSLERSKAAPLEISLCTDEVRRQSGFSDLLAPYIQNIATLGFYELGVLEDLMQTLPDFPRSTPNLCSLEMSSLGDESDLNTSDDPFQPFPSTLRCLALFDVPLYPTFLHLRTLTEFTLHNYVFPLSLDALLTVLEENRLLETVDLFIGIPTTTLPSAQRRVPISDRFRHLVVSFFDVEDARPVISSIPVQRGADLELTACHTTAGLNSLLSSVSETHLANLRSPTYMNVCERRIRLSGPNGSFSFSGLSPSEQSLVGLRLLSFDKIRELHFGYPISQPTIKPRVFDPSLFPALETLAIKHDANVSNTLSIWLSSPKSSPSLKSLAFLNCDLSEEFMVVLTKFARNRQHTTAAWLYDVLIVNNRGNFPSPSSIHELRDYVRVVDIQIADSLPSDLT